MLESKVLLDNVCASPVTTTVSVPVNKGKFKVLVAASAAPTTLYENVFAGFLMLSLPLL